MERAFLAALAAVLMLATGCTRDNGLRQNTPPADKAVDSQTVPTKAAGVDGRVTVRVLVPCGLASGFRDVSMQIADDLPDVRFLTKVIPVVEMTDRVLSGEQKADVFVSLGYKEIERLEQAGKLAKNSLRNIAQFRFALIVGKGNPHGVRELADMLKPAVEHITMPPPHENSVGYYAQDILRNAGLWEKLQHKAVYPKTSAQVIKYMREGLADAAVVYDTCLIETYTPTGERKEAPVTVDKVAMVDSSLYPPMYAPAGIIVDSAEPDAAFRVIKYLGSQRCAEVFQRYGYSAPDDPLARTEAIQRARQ